ncbi:hypothetical protein GII33_18430 [Gordonia pseudamarae]|jgi:hypothetical protein|uniref:Uncharacterized protein n=1 Tax=Gordonia pseudamarae TaxID=2831662 RepID=A0ABX6IL84_9ACTN|nr:MULTISPECIES: hypothetical protein [Gordonia]MBD0020609.1 hypothetical protein [Gordonia sp. (in: high G+C Gram-positive bacteria)]QHN27658.1 hypothetical protein GII33_18430 [Gordonia pseudamarae]QHN36540.1 hypothetical protein GII31_18205 [Gordonia pseudamarae]
MPAPKALPVRHRLTIAMAAAAAAASIAGIGSATAWIDAPGHAGSGVIDEGKVVVTFKNPTAEKVTCFETIYTANKLGKLSEAAKLYNTSFKQRAAGNPTQADETAAKADAIMASAGTPLKKQSGWHTLNALQSESTTWVPPQPALSEYAGYVECSSADGSGLERDHSAFAIKPKSANGSGSLDDIFGS